MKNFNRVFIKIWSIALVESLLFAFCLKPLFRIDESNLDILSYIVFFVCIAMGIFMYTMIGKLFEMSEKKASEKTSEKKDVMPSDCVSPEEIKKEETTPAPEVNPIVDKKKLNLNITFFDGSTKGWHQKTEDMKYTYYRAFRDFFHWYISRPQSKIYNFIFNHGSTIMRRKDIKWVDLSEEKIKELKKMPGDEKW